MSVLRALIWTYKGSFFFIRPIGKVTKFIRNRTSLLEIIENIAWDQLRSTDRNLYNDEFFKDVNARRAANIDYELSYTRYQNIAFAISVLLYFDVITKFSFLGIEFRLDKLMLFLVLAISYFDFVIFFTRLKNIPLQAAVAAWSRIKSKGERPLLYYARYGRLPNFKSTIISGSALLDLKRLDYKNLVKHNAATNLMGLAGISIILIFLAVIVFFIFYHALLVALYIDAAIATEITKWVTIPLLTAAAFNQIFMRVIVFAAAYGVIRPSES